jgi:uncharacterized C2H2 Zn-finger protein
MMLDKFRRRKLQEAEEMKPFSDPKRGDYIRSAIYVFIYVAMIGVGAFLLLPRYWYLWAGLVVVGLVLLVNWHKEMTTYQCPNCGHLYEISFLTDLLAPHGLNRQGGWLLLRCPNCRQWRKTKVLKRAGK